MFSMSPQIEYAFSGLRFFFIGIISIPALFSCFEPTPFENSLTNRGIVKIHASIIDESISKVVVRISASDMDTIARELTIENELASGAIPGVLTGENRKFEIFGFTNATQTHYGCDSLDVTWDDTATISLVLEALVGKVNFMCYRQESIPSNLDSLIGFVYVRGDTIRKRLSSEESCHNSFDNVAVSDNVVFEIVGYSDARVSFSGKDSCALRSNEIAEVNIIFHPVAGSVGLEVDIQQYGQVNVFYVLNDSIVKNNITLYSSFEFSLLLNSNFELWETDNFPTYWQMDRIHRNSSAFLRSDSSFLGDHGLQIKNSHPEEHIIFQEVPVKRNTEYTAQVVVSLMNKDKRAGGLEIMGKTTKSLLGYHKISTSSSGYKKILETTFNSGENGVISFRLGFPDGLNALARFDCASLYENQAYKARYSNTFSDFIRKETNIQTVLKNEADIK